MKNSYFQEYDSKMNSTLRALGHLESKTKQSEIILQ